MFENLKTIANNIINLFNRSKFSIVCCTTQTNVKVESPKRKYKMKARSPVKRQRTI